MADKQATQQSREPKFYDDVLNCRLRELLDSKKTRTEDFAKAVSVSSSAVRMWYNGYSRPDMEKIPEICKYFDVSADWLLGLSDTQSVDIELRDICKKTGLSENALLNLKRLNDQVNEGKAPYPLLSAQEQLWLINHFIEESRTVYSIADNANMYVNIRNAVENYETPDYDGTSAVDITKMGIEKFGMTFNFTHGQETVDYLTFMCQKHFLDFIEGIPMPAWLIKERKKKSSEN